MLKQAGCRLNHGSCNNMTATILQHDNGNDATATRYGPRYGPRYADKKEQPEKTAGTLAGGCHLPDPVGSSRTPPLLLSGAVGPLRLHLFKDPDGVPERLPKLHHSLRGRRGDPLLADRHVPQRVEVRQLSGAHQGLHRLHHGFASSYHPDHDSLPADAPFLLFMGRDPPVHGTVPAALLLPARAVRGQQFPASPRSDRPRHDHRRGGERADAPARHQSCKGAE